ncbi:MAG: hypothetical protein M0030_11440 [Actinomycetota bacterium]|nr:hypothetical protein [Actinomycetota bacterium]
MTILAVLAPAGGRHAARQPALARGVVTTVIAAAVVVTAVAVLLVAIQPPSCPPGRHRALTGISRRPGPKYEPVPQFGCRP